MHRQSTKVKEVAGSSRGMREPEPHMPPLFHPDPEENFSLWMQNCFPDASLVREHPIRQWLASPLETRVQRNRDYRAESVKSHGSEIPVAAPPKTRDGAHSNETSTGNPKPQLGWNSRMTGGSKEEPSVGGFGVWIGNNSTLRLKFGRYLVLALLLIAVFWATPMRKETSLANASIAGTQTNKTELTPDARRLVPRRQQVVETPTDFATRPVTIENLTVGCEDTQPCIEISTRGNGALPKLSTLSDPDRVVMDFQDAVLSFNVHRITVGRGAVKAVRIVENGAQSPRTRVVIDLTEKCDYELHTLTNGVVLTVYRKAAPHQDG